MMSIENWVNTFALAAVILGCVFHLNAHVDRSSTECEAWGFILTPAGAFGTLVTIWWPRFEIPYLGYDTIMHCGMALIAGWLINGKVRAWIGTFPGLDRKSVV